MRLPFIFSIIHKTGPLFFTRNIFTRKKNTSPTALRLQNQCLKCAFRDSNPGQID